MPQVTDQMGRTIEVSDQPKRIISLVPSQTELLADLGLSDEVIGITKFCVHPKKWFRTKTRVGGTKKLNLEQIAALEPDLIIGNKEENEREPMEWLMQRFPVWMSDIATLDDAVDMINSVGGITGKAKEAQEIANRVTNDFKELKPVDPASVAYFIWRQPWMLSGQGTFINDVLQRIGLQNVAIGMGRYPELNDRQLRKLQPQLILLSSEPYPFKHRHFEELQAMCPSARILLVDGEMFSWYGSRLLKFKEYYKELAPRLQPYSV